jgi:ribosome biogenesis GTPase A
VRAGGVVDMQKVCEVVIQDFRRGSLGRVSLERPG